jgi:hypothetical protein
MAGRSAMMTTAVNEADGVVVSILDMSLELRDRLHGRRTATANGFLMACRGCGGPVHLVRRDIRMFFRHNPGAGRRCIFDGLEPSGEGEAHYAAKLGLAAAFKSLSGYTVDCERTFSANGDVVRADVYTENSEPSGDHQKPMLWEIQLTPQPHGTFVRRTDEARRVTGHPRAWLTPFDTDLGDVRGIVTDRHGQKVIDRLYTDPYMTAPMEVLPTGSWARAVARRRPRLLWSQSGEDGQWISYPPHSNMVAPTTSERRRVDPLLAEDRECDRPQFENVREPEASSGARVPAWRSPLPPQRPEATELYPAAPAATPVGQRPYWLPGPGERCIHKFGIERHGALWCSVCGQAIEGWS